MGRTISTNGNGRNSSNSNNHRRMEEDSDDGSTVKTGMHNQPLNTLEKLERLRALGLTQFTETDLISCLNQCGHNLERTAEMLVTGMYNGSNTTTNNGSNSHCSRSNINTRDDKNATTTTTAEDCVVSSSSSSMNQPRTATTTTTGTVVTTTPSVHKSKPYSAAKTVTPKTPTTSSKDLRTEAREGITMSQLAVLLDVDDDDDDAADQDATTDRSIDADQCVDRHDSVREWLLCHRVIPDAICTARKGRTHYQETFTLSPSFSKKARPILYFRGKGVDGRFPEKLSALLVPLLLGGENQKQVTPSKKKTNDIQEPEQTPLLRVECQAYMEDVDIPMGGHLPVSLMIWIPRPEEFFQIFGDDFSGCGISVKASFGMVSPDKQKSKRATKTPSPLSPMASAAFQLLQWAEYGDLPQFTPVCHEEKKQGMTKKKNHTTTKGSMQESEDENLVEMKEQDFEDDPTSSEQADNELAKAVSTSDEWASKLPEAQAPPGFQNGLQLRPYQKQALHWMQCREVEGSSRQQMEDEFKLLTELASQQQQQQQKQNQQPQDTEPTLTSSDFVIHCDCGPVRLSNKAKLSTKAMDGEVNPLTHPLWKTRYLASPKMNHSLCFFVNELMGMATHKTPKPPTPCSGGILADDMGLGKTVMLLALILQQKVGNAKMETRLEGPSTTLVVAKLSLLPQWEDEIRTKTNLSYHVHYGTSTGMDNFEDVDVVLTTYGTIQGEAKRKNPVLTPIHWLRVILDEAHCIRNQQTLAAKVCCNLNAEHRWCVTGTVIQNSVADLFGLMKFLHHEPWCIPSFWQRAIAKPLSTGMVEGDLNGKERTMAFNLVLGRLRRVLAPIMLRRTKNSLTSDGRPILSLPPVETKIIHVDLSASERGFYDALRARSVELFDGFVDRGVAAKSYLKILSLIIRLRQACDHISLTIRNRLEEEDMITLDAEDPTPKSSKEAHMKDPIELENKNDDGAVIEAKFLTDLYDKFVRGPPQSKKRVRDDCTEEKEPNKSCRPNNYVSAVADALSDAVAKNLSHVEEECPICLEKPRIEDAVLTPCAHIYCKKCLVGVLQENAPNEGGGTLKRSPFFCPDGKCPLCNSNIEARKIVTLLKLDNGEYTTSFLSSSKPVATTARDTREGNAGSSARLILEASIQRNDNDSSKMIAVTNELYAIWELDPGSKVIVFSQFLGFLDLMEVRLKKESISFSRLDGKLSMNKRMKVLEQFRTSQLASSAMESTSSPRSIKKGAVLLISMAAGAEGLNLVAASSVFIVDPWWNVAREDQCINRIHRIGQCAAQVRVRKFVVRDSVETRIIELQQRKKHVADEVYNDVGRQVEDSGDAARLSMDDFKLIFR